jgi:hypothetical protein
VLPYADTPEELTAFFRSTAQHLKAGGPFVSIVLDPFFLAFGEMIGARRITRLPSNLDRVDFLDAATGAVVMTVTPHRYSRDVHRTLRHGGRHDAGGVERVCDAGGHRDHVACVLAGLP